MNIQKSVRSLMSTAIFVCMMALLFSCGGGGDADSAAAPGKTGTITLTTDVTTLPADGSSSANIHAVIKDSAGDPVRHYTEVTFTTTLGRFKDGKTYTMSTQPPLGADGLPNLDAAPTGIADAALIAATQAGTARVTVTSSGVTQSVNIEMTGGLVSGISLSVSSGSVSTDNSDTTTITATVLDANNAALKDTTVTFAASSGALSSPAVVTDENGQATVTFSCGNQNNSNRTCTITAAAFSVSSQILIQATGTKLVLETDFQNLEITNAAISSNIDSEKAILTIAAKDAGDNRISNAFIIASVDPSSTGNVSLSPSSGYTNSTGELKIEVFGKAKGNVIVRVEGLGASATLSYSVGLAGEVFSIISPQEDPYSLLKGASLTIVVQAPTQNQVIFATTCGAWDGGTSTVVTKAVTDQRTSAVLSSTEACNATVQVYDAADANTSDSMKVNIYPPADSAARIDLQASAYVVALSSGGILNSVVLEATVRDNTFQIVPNVAVSFSISDSTGGGEYVSPPLAYTLSGSGKAEATFTSGSVSSGARGVTVTATVVGKATVTDSISIVIGGTAGSVVLGQSTSIESINNDTSYKLPMTAQVVDSNGNPVAGARISLQLWPSYYRTGIWIPTADGPSNCVPEISNTYPNEDDKFPGTSFYRNLILDPGEDANGNGQLTPASSAAGSVPAEVFADETGVANFDLIFPKSSAVWIMAELTGSTLVLGSETRSTTQFGLPYLAADAKDCLLPDSPYNDSQPTLEIVLTATPDKILPYDGIGIRPTSSIRAQVTQLGNPVKDGTLVSFAIVSGGGSFTAELSEISDTTTAGQAGVIYYSGDRPEVVTIRAVLLDGTTGETTVTLTRGAGEVFTIVATPTPDTLSADGSSMSFVRAVVSDDEGYPVFNETEINFAITDGPASGGLTETTPGVFVNEVTTKTKAGIASAVYHAGNIPGEVLIRVRDKYGADTGPLPGELVTITLEEVIGSMTLVADPTSIPADNFSSSAITATIKDTGGQPVQKGTKVTFDNPTKLGKLSTPIATTPDDSGVVTVSLKSLTTPGTELVTAKATIGESPVFTTASTTVTFTSDSNSVLTINALPNTIDITTGKSIITATLKDIDGNVVEGAEITFTDSPINSGTFDNVTENTDPKGEAQVVYTAGATARIVTITATCTGCTGTPPSKSTLVTIK